MIQVKLLIFCQCKYSLANAKSSSETKQKGTHRADFLAPGAIPHACKFDFQQEAGVHAVLNPCLLKQAPACSHSVTGKPLSCWAAQEFRLLGTGQEWDPSSGWFSFLEEFYSSCLGIYLVRLGWLESNKKWAREIKCN